MGLLQTWRELAYEREMSERDSQIFWANYFNIEKGIYEKILANPDEVVSGTVKELAEKYGTELMIMVGFLDGIDESLKTPNNIEEMTEDTVVSLDFDKELLYKNMVECKAEWLYTLPQWDSLLSEEKSLIFSTFNIIFSLIMFPTIYEPNTETTSNNKKSCNMLRKILLLPYKLPISLILNVIPDFINSTVGINMKDIIVTFIIDRITIIHGSFLSIFPLKSLYPKNSNNPKNKVTPKIAI